MQNPLSSVVRMSMTEATNDPTTLACVTSEWEMAARGAGSGRQSLFVTLKREVCQHIARSVFARENTALMYFS